MPGVVTQSPPRRPRHIWGIRRRPGRLALALFRMPLRAYHHGKGWLLGHTFVVLTHIGRTSGQPHQSVLMVLRIRHDPFEVVVCSAWGAESDWLKNIRAHTAVRVECGRESFEPEQSFLSDEESVSVVLDWLRQHPWRFRLMARVLGWGDLQDELVAREFVRIRPFVSFRPRSAPQVP